MADSGKAPAIGETVGVDVRFTTTTFDQVVIS
jgi:hypothetical protein